MRDGGRRWVWHELTSRIGTRHDNDLARQVDGFGHGRLGRRSRIVGLDMFGVSFGRKVFFAVKEKVGTGESLTHLCVVSCVCVKELW
jgi:hypothetical protein